MRGSHEQPLAVEDWLARIRPTPNAHWLVATGDYSPTPAAATRVFVFEDRGRRLHRRVDNWIASADLGVLTTALAERGSVCSAKSDAMYATSPVHIWGSVGGELCLWHGLRLVARFGAESIWLKRGWWRDAQVLPVSAVQAVRAFVAPDWVRRGVTLRRSLRDEIVVARKRELSVLLDPTYDGIDLLCDAVWVAALARDIAQFTGLTLEVDTDLG